MRKFGINGFCVGVWIKGRAFNSIVRKWAISGALRQLTSIADFTTREMGNSVNLYFSETPETFSIRIFDNA